MEELRASGEVPVGRWADFGMLPDSCRVEDCLDAWEERRVFLLTGGMGGARYVLKTSPAEDFPRLLSEYELLLKLHDGAFPHPIACMLDGDRAFLIREYVPGRTLAALVEAEGALGARRAADIAMRICAAVSVLQSLTPPIIHRAITPRNILLREDGSVCLIDLEAAGERTPEHPSDATPITAPELSGCRWYDERTDVYAIGMLMVYLTTGGYDAAALRKKRVPQSLRRIILGCLEYDPKRRPACAKQIKALLFVWQRRAARWVRRVATAAAAILAVLALALYAEPLTRYFESVAIVAGSPAYVFASPLIEKAVRLQLGKSRGAIMKSDLAGVTDLCLCAETPFMEWEDLWSYGVDEFVNGESHLEYARLDDLSDLRSLPNLRRLALDRLGIKDISLITELPLTHLGLGSNEIRDIAPLAGMRTLSFLDLSNNPIYSLDDLANCPSLTWLNVSAVPVLNLNALTELRLDVLQIYDMLPAFDASALKDMTSLKNFTSSNFPNTGVRALSKLTGLRDVGIFGCETDDLTPFQGMRELSYLMLSHGPQKSLEGISSLESLINLDVSYDDALTSLEPLRGNAVLRRLKISGSPVTDFSVLETMPNLTEVICSSDQKPLLNALSGGTSFSVSIED